MQDTKSNLFYSRINIKTMFYPNYTNTNMPVAFGSHCHESSLIDFSYIGFGIYLNRF